MSTAKAADEVGREVDEMLAQAPIIRAAAMMKNGMAISGKL